MLYEVITEVAVVVLILLVEGDVAKRLVWHELFLFWVLPCEVEISMPCA